MLTENWSFVLKYGSITSAIVNSPFELSHTGLLHKAKKAGFFHLFGQSIFAKKKRFLFQKSRFSQAVSSLIENADFTMENICFKHGWIEQGADEMERTAPKNYVRLLIGNELP